MSWQRTPGFLRHGRHFVSAIPTSLSADVIADIALAIAALAGIFSFMEPIINLEETPGKTVGRRRIQDPFALGMKLQRSVSNRRFNDLPKGAYKFNSHEEADEWYGKC